jgi:hypothetical protein
MINLTGAGSRHPVPRGFFYLVVLVAQRISPLTL